MNIKYLLIAIIAVLVGTTGYLGYKVTTDRNNLGRMGQPPQGGFMNNKDPQENGDGIPNSRGTQGMRQQESKKNCVSDGCLAVSDLEYPAGNLTEDAKTALTKALDDEYKAWATYDAVITKLGSTRPFNMIIRAEEQHISTLKAIFDKYGLNIPENQYDGKITSPETIELACKTGVSDEIANASLYKDELLPKVRDYEDITIVFNNLMNASQDKHLPAFERCAE